MQEYESSQLNRQLTKKKKQIKVYSNVTIIFVDRVEEHESVYTLVDSEDEDDEEEDDEVEEEEDEVTQMADYEVEDEAEHEYEEEEEDETSCENTALLGSGTSRGITLIVTPSMSPATSSQDLSSVHVVDHHHHHHRQSSSEHHRS